MGNTSVHFPYNVVLPGNCYQPLTVSIGGSIDALSKVTEEQISEACAALRPLLVSFAGCKVSICSINGEQRKTIEGNPLIDKAYDLVLAA